MAYFQIACDYETSEHAGAGGMFQLETVIDTDGNDVTDKVDVGIHFPDGDEERLIRYLRKTFNIPEHEEVNIDYL